MAEDSENQSITSEDLQKLMLEEINDPMVARVEAKMQARIEVKLQTQSGTSVNSRRYINRDHEAGHAKLVAEYFAENPLYTDYQFRRRFRMRKHIFFANCGSIRKLVPIFSVKERCIR